MEHILLVEDNPADVRLMQVALQEAGAKHALHVARDGEAALAFLERRDKYQDAPRPDLVLLDLNLPRRSGVDVLAAIKGDQLLRSIPVVILTTSSAASDIAATYDLHANCYITKPLDLDRLVEIVRGFSRFWGNIVTLPPAAPSGGS